jgi:AGZA family xanthine/uracil permease-like MFS transporter
MEAHAPPLARRFAFAERGTNLRVEVLGGVATFLTMSYILFVNPAILSAAGIPFNAVAVATAIVAAVATLAMALATNLPLALAPGLGINAVVAFDLILGRKLPWPVAMSVIVIEGLLALVLVLAGLREAIMRAIPLPMKLSIGVGIGLFITLVGLREAGIVVNNPATGIGPRRPHERAGADRAGRDRRRGGALGAQRPRLGRDRRAGRDRARPDLRGARRA